MHKLKGLFSIHLAWINQNRQRNKIRFYQVSTLSDGPKKSKISLIRYYYNWMPLGNSMPEESYKYYENHGLNIWNYIDLDDEGAYYTSEALRIFERDGIRKYAILDIWDEGWMKRNNLKDPRNVLQKMLHGYLRWTNPRKNTFWVRCVDKLLKYIV